MIVVEHLSKHFGKTAAVDDISFEVKEGETLVLLGTSGCGKTTTLKMINRLTEPSGGRISVNGKDVLAQNPDRLRRGIGYVLQNNGLFPHYSVAETMAIVPKLLKWGQTKINERTKILLEKLHLPESYLSLYPNELSGGQQQRVGLARALMADPPVLLMDEAFGALDPITRASIRREFKNLDELKRKTIVMVTHDVQEAFEMADRICLMDAGKIKQIGTPAELLFNPADAFVASFLDDQRLQLELKTVSLNDLWDDASFTGEKSVPEISAASSIWEAVSFLQKNNLKQVCIHQPKTNSWKLVNAEELMHAFFTHKKFGS
ncbi:ABC transporter ATP-binding protein [Mucilaginibacter arboris]|uniref:ATP-binding cassette domain-containing protein n=1 Tax=Mucilaginibacter arboris TaxID=2682090 RepID=A0A7K1SZQ6_9SPHI|nr:ATP-binding cassette domain-containing protein [Mucilaginibacter arboris]MVN22796.1 ATP-binding cassette domain-containing protein [Mucilaginibacter arboris]